MRDPRKDLREDGILWELVLTCATAYKDKQIFGNLHGFRCAGARLYVKDLKGLSFKMPEEWDEKNKQDMKQKYALPCVEQFRELFQFIAEYYHKHENERNYLDRDIFIDGYLP